MREGLRPTPDRVRETLFNWLTPTIQGRQVLDLFAGSGALGVEALSRGAARAVFVESDARVAEALRENLTQLGTDPGLPVKIEQRDTLHFLSGAANREGGFDLVFLDPPYTSGLLVPTIVRLVEGDWLKRPAWAYVEAARGETPPVPGDWQLYRSGQTREVGYHLYLVE